MSFGMSLEASIWTASQSNNEGDGHACPAGLQHSIAQQEVQHKAGQRKSGQHEAGQHKAGQCEAGQSEAGQHEAGQRKSGQRKSGQHEAGQHEAAQEADRFLHESLDPLSAAGAPPGRSASAYAYGMSVSSSHTQELPRAINTSNHPQPLQTHPLSDMIFPRASVISDPQALDDPMLDGTKRKEGKSKQPTEHYTTMMKIFTWLLLTCSSGGRVQQHNLMLAGRKGAGMLKAPMRELQEGLTLNW
eukprot:1138875-Pelagomonas_calceolata.AAC.4